MSNITTTIRNFNATVTDSTTTPTIYNVNATLANTEYSQALSLNTKAIVVRARDMTTLKIAFVSGDTATNYITVPSGCTYNESNLNFSGTLYVSSSKAAQVVEILEWA